MTRIPVTCPSCGRIRHLQPSDAKTVRRCRRCHLQAIAPLGFQATAAKYDHFFAIDKARDWRIRHPSTLEQTVEVALAQIDGIKWEREYEVLHEDTKWFVDFLVYTRNGRIALEVQGAWVHRHQPTPKLTIRTCYLGDCFDALIFLHEEQIRASDFAQTLPRLLDLQHQRTVS